MTPEKYKGRHTDQSQEPWMADQPRRAPQLNVSPKNKENQMKKKRVKKVPGAVWVTCTICTIHYRLLTHMVCLQLFLQYILPPFKFDFVIWRKHLHKIIPPHWHRTSTSVKLTTEEFREAKHGTSGLKKAILTDKAEGSWSKKAKVHRDVLVAHSEMEVPSPSVQDLM